MLDTDSDTETVVAKLRVTAPSHDVEETVRHLTPQEFQAYASGQLTAARLSHCQSHLDACEDCRSELEELRTFKNDLATFPRPEPNRGVLRKQRRGITLPWAAAITIVVVAGVSTALWWKHGSTAANKTPVAGASARAPAAVAATPATLAPATMPAGLAAAPGTPRSAAGSVPAAVAAKSATGRAAAPVATRSAAGSAAAPVATRSAAGSAAAPVATRSAAGSASAAVAARSATGPAAPPAVPETRVFALLSPLGPTIADLRPEFTWQELPGALHYSVVIVDARLRPVQHSSALHTTSWQPRHPLHHGRTYLWQVTATLHGGKKIVASAPATITEAK